MDLNAAAASPEARTPRPYGKAEARVSAAAALPAAYAILSNFGPALHALCERVLLDWVED